MAQGKAPDWSDELEVTEEELQNAVRRGLRGNTAPGPDGIHKRVLALAWPVLADHFRQLFTSCLKLGAFPQVWRRVNLVLLP